MAINFLEERALKPISLFFFTLCLTAHGLKLWGTLLTPSPTKQRLAADPGQSSHH